MFYVLVLFVRVKSFRKKNKQAWNCLDNLIYYTTVRQVLIESSQNLLEACNFINKENLAQVFSCEFYEFLRTPFFTEHLLWLLPFRYIKINAFIRQHFQTNYWPLSCMMVVSKFSGKVIFMFIMDLHGQNSNFLSTMFIEKFDISKACVRNWASCKCFKLPICCGTKIYQKSMLLYLRFLFQYLFYVMQW